MIARLLLLLLLLAPPGAALARGDVPGSEAGAESPVAAAVEAAALHERWCSSVAASQSTRAAEAMVELSPALRDVSLAYDQRGDPALLYWRGMLHQCLNQDARAVEDFVAFVDQVGDESRYQPQVEDAERRLRRLTLGASVGPRTLAGANRGGVVVGAILVGTGGAFGGLAGWQDRERARAQAAYDAGNRPWAQTAGHLDDARSASLASRAMLGAAVGSATAGLATLLVSSLSASSRPVATVAVTAQGVHVAVGGRW